MATNYPGNIDSFVNPTTASTLDSPSHSLQHSDANDAIEAIEIKLGIGASAASSASSGQVLTKGTGNSTLWSNITSLSSPIITGGTATGSLLVSPEESVSIIATASSGTVNAEMISSGVTFATANASANWVMNLRGNSTTTINSVLAVGQAITHIYLNTNGTTAYYPTSYQVDGTAITPRWQAAGTPTSGNASSIDAYAFTLIKTGTTPTYTLLASQTRFG